eukprot:8405680-Alexandrium_andersonii.AAC.1
MTYAARCARSSSPGHSPASLRQTITPIQAKHIRQLPIKPDSDSHQLSHQRPAASTIASAVVLV